MRLFFLLLLAVNVGVFAWTRFLASPDPSVDRQPLARQVNPDKLRIVSDGELAPTPPREKPKPAPPAPAAPSASPPAAALVACLEWGSFSPADASRAAKDLDALNLGPRLAQYRGEETASWWVHMPPQGSRANAQKKAAELKKLGIEDFFIVQDTGPQRWALSLGVFSTEQAAQAYLEALRDKRVRSAVIGQRDTRVPKVWFQVRDVEAALQARLADLAREFDGATLHDCTSRN